jgi:hypothetical protein
VATSGSYGEYTQPTHREQRRGESTSISVRGSYRRDTLSQPEAAAMPGSPW